MQATGVLHLYKQQNVLHYDMCQQPTEPASDESDHKTSGVLLAIEQEALLFQENILR